MQALQWNTESHTWTATIANDSRSHTEEFSAVITAVGQLNRPNLAPASGIEHFNGDWFHSAHWNHKVDLRGKRIAVIGTGASAMQFMPTLAATAGDVTIFQRSPQWVRPNSDYHRTVSENTVWLLENMPFMRSGIGLVCSGDLVMDYFGHYDVILNGSSPSVQ